jgi:hypothetical protein
MSDRISFACPACRARIKVSVRYVGRSGNCPACARTIVVPPQPPEDAPPVLVEEQAVTLRQEMLFLPRR